MVIMEGLKREDLMEWFALKKLSDRTVKEYLYYFEKLEAFKYPWIDKDCLFKFLSRKKLNNGVVRAFINNLVEFVDQKEDLVDMQKRLSGFKLPRRTGRSARKIPKVLSLAQIVKIAKATTCRRDKLMILVCFYGGLRASELINIKPHDFSWDKWKQNPRKTGHLKVRGKGKKERIVFIHPLIMANMHQWINGEVRMKQGSDIPLFNFSYMRWWHIFERACINALGYYVNPHTLRHSRATYLLDKGLNIKEVAEYLGHASTETTQIYLHISREKLQSKIENIF